MAERGTSTRQAPGERLDLESPEATPEVVYRHLRRYWVAMQRLIERGVYGPEVQILDWGCGYGYGSLMLLGLGNVTAYDPIVGGERDWSTKLAPFGQDEYDAIVCIEVYEHMSAAEQGMFLKRARRLLKPGGYLYLTCPLGNDGPNPNNPWHLHEPSRESLRAALDAHFKQWRFWDEAYASTSGPAIQATVLARTDR